MTSSPVQVVLASSQKTITLKAEHWLACGGQADVYVFKNTAYKIYNDDNRVRNTQLNLWPNLTFFDSITHPNIAKPLDILLNPSGFKVGLTMPAISAEPLCKAFHSNWHQKHQLSPSKILHICTQMQNIILHVHSKNALLIDGNELNWLISTDGTPWLIDTDSWQYPGHPATAIMPSINDPLAHIPTPNQFSAQSDWFAWAVLTFQLWTGIHPYKGSHPQYKPTQFLQRIKDGISCLDPSVSVPASVRPWSLIPAPLLQWYQDIFAHKHRLAPPSLSGLTPHAFAANPTTTPFTASAPALCSTAALFIATPRDTPALPPNSPPWRALPSGHLISSSTTHTSLLVNNRVLSLAWPQPIQPSSIAALHLSISLASNQPPIALIALGSDGIQALSPDPSLRIVLPPLDSKDFLFGSQEGRVFVAQASSSEHVFELRPTLLGSCVHIQAIPWPLKMLGSLWGQGAVISWLGSGSNAIPQISTLRPSGLSPSSTWSPTMHHAPSKALLPYKCLDVFALAPHLVFVSAIERTSKTPYILRLALHQNTEYLIEQRWDLDSPQELNALIMPNSNARAYVAVLSFLRNSQVQLLLAAGEPAQLKQLNANALSLRIQDAPLFFNQHLFCLDSTHCPHNLKLQAS